MGTHMKTTTEIPDDLIRRAKALATKRGVTLRAIIEQGIRAALNENSQAASYELPDKSVSGNGLTKEFVQGNWTEVRTAAYSGRGG